MCDGGTGVAVAWGFVVVGVASVRDASLRVAEDVGAVCCMVVWLGL